jgi:hypothetical protein
MKNLKSLIVVLALVFSSQTFAGNNNDNGGNKLFSKKIQKVLSAAKVKSNSGKSEKVTVNFVVNDNGDVIEACAQTSNKEIKQYVEKQFMTLNLKGLQPCVTNTVDVNFINY